MWCAASKMAPKIPASWYLHPCIIKSLPWSVGWTYKLTCNEENRAEMIGCHFRDKVIKTVAFVLGTLTFALPL